MDTPAIIFLPDEEPLDGKFSRQCVTHIERRGYRLLTILRDWATVMQVLRNREAHVVVVAREEHLDPVRQPRVEFVGEETVRLSSTRVARALMPRDGGRHRRPRIVS